MPTRQELQARIAELDRRINEELSKTRLPSLDSRRRQFPKADYIVAALLIGYHYVGGQIPVIGQFHDITSPWDLYLGAAVAAIAVLRTILWVFKGNPKADANYVAATSAVRDLQAQKRDLQAQLKELSD
ncbi:MAG: hypothetical protein N2111_07315 [Candidatus Sumerlaeaceae bacterium]|nr:hypothetical protein [Candidatus Sumerlaeaceae bacterium]